MSRITIALDGRVASMTSHNLQAALTVNAGKQEKQSLRSGVSKKVGVKISQSVDFRMGD